MSADGQRQRDAVPGTLGVVSTQRRASPPGLPRRPQVRRQRGCVWRHAPLRRRRVWRRERGRRRRLPGRPHGGGGAFGLCTRAAGTAQRADCSAPPVASLACLGAHGPTQPPPPPRTTASTHRLPSRLPLAAGRGWRRWRPCAAALLARAHGPQQAGAAGPVRVGERAAGACCGLPEISAAACCCCCMRAAWMVSACHVF